MSVTETKKSAASVGNNGETRIIADWSYWFSLKAKTLKGANNQTWRKNNRKTLAAQADAQLNYLDRWAKNKHKLLNKKNK